MVLNIAACLWLAGLAILLGWLAVRAWRSPRPITRWLGGIFGTLFALMFIALTFGMARGLVEVYRVRPIAAPDLQVEVTPERVERGRYLANSFCVGCHSQTGEFPMMGGVDLADDIPLPIGSMMAANLTPAGPLKSWSDGEIFRALRDGVGVDGRRLLMMSLVQTRYMSDDDLQAVIAFLRSQEPVEKEYPEPLDQPNPLGILMAGAGLLPAGLPPVTEAIVAPPKGPTVEYGEYILSWMDCIACHGPDLAGGTPSPVGPPAGPSLRVVKGWTPEGFVATMRTGIDPSGNVLDPDRMPYRPLGRLDDTDLTAMFLYLSSLP